MKHIITGFEAVAGQACVLTALHNISRFNKCDYSESDLFFLCNELNVEYRLDLNYIANNSVVNLPNLEKEAGIRVHMSDNKYGNAFIEKVYGLIVENKLVMLFVNTCHLTYDSIYKDNTNRYHAILIYGIDTENNLAFIADSHLRNYLGEVSIFQGAVSLKEISAAVYRFAWFDFTNKKDLNKTDIFTAARDNFEEFLNGHEQDGKIFYGMAALKKYIDDFHKLSLLEDSQLAGTCLNLNYFIKICSFNYINNYLISFIRENSAFIKINTDVIFNTEEVLNSLEAISLEWIKAALSILKLGKSLKKDRICNIIEKGKVLLGTQTNVYYKFLDLLKHMLREQIK
ncbi:MAG: hypothetical protein K0R50_2427 [Eubacterium sp.]|jgi:hypothetical protein|nr:hypothetical protein [Eubacterium sp.]